MGLVEPGVSRERRNTSAEVVSVERSGHGRPSRLTIGFYIAV